MRKALYFEQDIGKVDSAGDWRGYRAGEWYDNVPDADHDFALANGLAHEVTEAECGCKLAKGCAVSLSQEPVIEKVPGERGKRRINFIPCSEHAATALRDHVADFDPEFQAVIRAKVARLKEQQSLEDMARTQGLV